VDFEPSDFGKWHIRQGPEPNGFGKSDWGQTRAYEWFGTTTVTHNAVSCRSHLRSLLLARQSIHKCDPPLGFNLDCSRWLHRQLKNCSFLTFSHRVQEHMTSRANDNSVPGRTQTTTFESSDAANPRVPVPEERVVSLSPTFAGRDLTLWRL